MSYLDYKAYNRTQYVKETDPSKYKSTATEEDRRRINIRRDLEAQRDLNSLIGEVWDDLDKDL